MGINLFVEGIPDPVVIKIKLSREINNFKDLKEVVDDLNFVQRFFKSNWPKIWEGNYPISRTRRETILLSFKLGSPPELTIFSDPAWLAVFISLLVGYKDIKGNMREIAADIDRLFSNIEGLTERELELLDMAVRLFLEKQLERGERIAKRVIKRIRKLRKSLMGADQGGPGIKVKKLRDL